MSSCPVLRDSLPKLGPYVLYETLGSGGMATVYRAELRVSAKFRRMVALKQLHPHLAWMPEMVALFVNEARLGAYLKHANVVQTLDFGNADGAYFIAMEYVPGPTLAQVARHYADLAGPIPFPIALGILSQLCDALDHVHNLRDELGEPLGLVHRDVSPTNIIISHAGIVKLVDFGISKAEISRVHTQAGLLRGKLGYIAPEYLQGPLDARADLFAVGVIAYELLANQPLFVGLNEFDTLTRLREMPIPSLSRRNPQVPRELDAVVMTALQRDPDLRWQTAGGMKAALAEVARISRVRVGPPQIREWIEQAFPKRAAPDPARPDDARGHADRPELESTRAAQPEPLLPVHEISTIFVHGSATGSEVTRVFRPGPQEPATRGFRPPGPPPDPVVATAATTKFRSPRLDRDTRRVLVRAIQEPAPDRDGATGPTASQRMGGEERRDPSAEAAELAAHSAVMSIATGAAAPPARLTAAGTPAVVPSPRVTPVPAAARAEAREVASPPLASGSTSTAPSVASSSASSGMSRRPVEPAGEAGASGIRRASNTTSVILVPAGSGSNHLASPAAASADRPPAGRRDALCPPLWSWQMVLLVSAVTGYLAACITLLL